MAYTKNTWVDQDVERPKTYEVTNNQDGSITLTDSFGLVTELGTPVNADNMNHIENGIADCYDYVNTQITAMLSTIYPVGSIYISTSATNPLESLFGTWELVSAGKALWTGNGQAGSGTTTQSNYANAKANTTIAAGLPNITGVGMRVSPEIFNNKGCSGAIYASGSNTGGGGENGDRGFNYGGGFNFDASRSNSIYGKSSTVQPPAYVVNVWRRTA